MQLPVLENLATLSILFTRLFINPFFIYSTSIYRTPTRCQKPFLLKFFQVLFVELHPPLLPLLPLLGRTPCSDDSGVHLSCGTQSRMLLLRKKHNPRGSVLHTVVSGGENNHPHPHLKRKTGLTGLIFAPSTYVAKRSLIPGMNSLLQSESRAEIIDRKT